MTFQKQTTIGAERQEDGSWKIPLTQGQFAIIDDCDFADIASHKWCAFVGTKSGKYYAIRKASSTRKNQKKIMMHRQILNLGNSVQGDHINGDTLDNRRCNLRACNLSQNAINSKLRSTNKSGFRGIHKNGKGWSAHIRGSGVSLHLGTYATKEAAARAYDDAARRLHGEFARLNFPAAVAP